MNPEELLALVTDAADDLKAINTQVLDVREKANFTDYMVVTSGASTRQVRAIADNIIDKVKQRGMRPLGIEGEQQGEWLLVDFGDVLVHVMHPSTRDFYQLEKLWSGGEEPEAENPPE